MCWHKEITEKEKEMKRERRGNCVVEDKKKEKREREIAILREEEESLSERKRELL